MSNNESLNEDGIIKEFSKIVSKNLGVVDEASTISKFILNLYKKSTSGILDETERYENFRDCISKNGGDEFSQAFLREAFILMEGHQNQSSSKDNLVMKNGSAEGKGHTNGVLSLPNSESATHQMNPKTSPFLPTQQQIAGSESTKHGDSNSKKEIKAGGIYRGFVSNITKYGAFIRLNDPRSYDSGLCHISHIAFDWKTKVRNVSDFLHLNQQVFVKVLDIKSDSRFINSRQKNRITLSLRGIDQDTGLEQNISTENESDERFSRSQQSENNRGTKRRLTSPERWELQQLVSSGALSNEKYHELVGPDDPDSAFQQSNKNDETEVDISIEVNNDAPKFLRGQAEKSIELAPVKVVRNPEGSLNRSALNGSKLAITMKEEDLKEQKELEKRLKREIAKRRDLEDPLGSDKLALQKNMDENTKSFISGWKSSQAYRAVSYGKRTTLTIKEQRESLPVFSLRDEILDRVRNNQFVVIVGETGSGKTTQIVQYLSEEGFNFSNGQHKMIACTQPRRVAAVSVAKRVSEEVGCRLGAEVGYTIRFEDMSSPKTNIKYMTDGMLQREALVDPLMRQYSVIMLDEAHERTVATDVLFGLLKKAANENPELKIIVTSATLDSTKFSKFFLDCPIITIPGRTFPVEILYAREPEVDYLASALDSVMQIHVSEPPGDILVFLTGQEEIDFSCEVLYDRVKSLKSAADLIILPVYSSLPSEIQSRIFEPTPPGSRKVILATNIAETSITIDGIYYVVDPGFVKINVYDSKLGMDSLKVTPISQAQANQRSGRAGRTGPGKCYRLYTEDAFKNEMLPNSIPEIQRQNLAHTILMLKAMGINDLVHFDFMDPPSTSSMLSALRDLYTLSALDDDGFLTSLGHRLANFPMEPALAKTLLSSVELSCSEEVLTVVAMLSVQTVFYRPKDKQKQADQKRYRFTNSTGDHLTLLNVYKSWAINGYDRRWCQDNFIQDRSMRKARDVRNQLQSIMRKHRHSIISCGSALDNVRKAFCAGFFKSSAKRDPTEGYKTLSDQIPVVIHPSSALYGKTPEYVIYHNLLLTTKEYMNCVSVIDPKWLLELAPTYFKTANADGLSSKRRNEKIVPLFDKFSKDQDNWRLSSHLANKKRLLGNR